MLGERGALLPLPEATVKSKFPMAYFRLSRWRKRYGYYMENVAPIRIFLYYGRRKIYFNNTQHSQIVDQACICFFIHKNFLVFCTRLLAMRKYVRGFRAGKHLSLEK